MDAESKAKANSSLTIQMQSYKSKNNENGKLSGAFVVDDDKNNEDNCNSE